MTFTSALFAMHPWAVSIGIVCGMRIFTYFAYFVTHIEQRFCGTSPRKYRTQSS